MRLAEHSLFPEVRAQLAVCLGGGIQEGLGKVASKPAISSSFSGTGTETMPAPVRAETRHSSMELQWPVTLHRVL